MTIHQTTGGIYITILPTITMTPDKIEIKNDSGVLYSVSKDLPELSEETGTTMKISLDEFSVSENMRCVVTKGSYTMEESIVCVPGVWTTAFIGELNLSTNKILLEDGSKLLLEDNSLFILE